MPKEEDLFRLLSEPGKTVVKARLEYAKVFCVREIPPERVHALISCNAEIARAYIVNFVKEQFSKKFKYPVKKGRLGQTRQAGKWLKSLLKLTQDVCLYKEIEGSPKLVWKSFNKTLQDISYLGISEITLSLYQTERGDLNSNQLIKLLKKNCMKIQSLEFPSSTLNIEFHLIIKEAISIAEKSEVFRKESLTPFIRSWRHAIDEIPKYASTAIITETGTWVRPAQGRYKVRIAEPQVQIVEMQLSDP